jgi:hypothetical protein
MEPAKGADDRRPATSDYDYLMRGDPSGQQRHPGGRRLFGDQDRQLPPLRFSIGYRT